jgi:hypothetical protein
MAPIITALLLLLIFTQRCAFFKGLSVQIIIKGRDNATFFFWLTAATVFYIYNYMTKTHPDDGDALCILSRSYSTVDGVLD